MKRREFLVVSASALSVQTGAIAHANSWSERFPKADVFKVSIGGMIAGQQVMFATKSGPIVVRYRTDVEISAARSISLSDIRDPLARNANLPPESLATDQNRTIDTDGHWFVFRPICTHLGAVVLEAGKPFSGDQSWISCPSHGGKYDSAGRVISGPPPTNLKIPIAEFVTNDILEIHTNANTGVQKRVRETHPSTW